MTRREMLKTAAGVMIFPAVPAIATAVETPNPLGLNGDEGAMFFSGPDGQTSQLFFRSLHASFTLSQDTHPTVDFALKDVVGWKKDATKIIEEAGNVMFAYANKLSVTLPQHNPLSARSPFLPNMHMKYAVITTDLAYKTDGEIVRIDSLTFSGLWEEYANALTKFNKAQAAEFAFNRKILGVTA